MWNYDLFLLDDYFDDEGAHVFVLVCVTYDNECNGLSAESVDYYFAHDVDNVFHIFERGLSFADDFEEFVFLYGEELGVPLSKEEYRFANKIDYKFGENSADYVAV